jgi:hypothetical protein
MSFQSLSSSPCRLRLVFHIGPLKCSSLCGSVKRCKSRSLKPRILWWDQSNFQPTPSFHPIPLLILALRQGVDATYIRSRDDATVLYSGLLPRRPRRLVKTYNMATALVSRPVGALACQKDSYLRSLETEVVSCTPLVPEKPTKGTKKRGGEEEAGETWQIEFKDSVLFPEGLAVLSLVRL